MKSRMTVNDPRRTLEAYELSETINRKGFVNQPEGLGPEGFKMSLMQPDRGGSDEKPELW